MQKAEKGLHAQIIKHIRERILSGELAVGDRLPSEAQLAQQHQTSRGTVRHALSFLEKEGLLERIQGSGTYVRPSSMTRERRIASPEVNSSGANSHSSRSEKSIGVILSEASDELNMDILRGTEQAAKPRGYQVSFAYTGENAQELALDIARLKASTAGLIIFPISNVSHDEAIAQLQRENFPFVLVDRYIYDLDCDYVVSDNIGGGYRATEHLLILGHTRIGFAYTPVGGLRTSSVRDRWEGYRRALQEYNQPYDESLVYYLSSKKEADTSTTTYDDVLSRPDRPSAIFAVNDSIALDFFRAAQRHSLRVPEDLALVGFDDVSFAAHLSVPLTTIAQQSSEMGMHAGTLLINRIESQTGGATKHIELPTNLIIRQSCGARLRVSSSTTATDG